MGSLFAFGGELGERAVAAEEGDHAQSEQVLHRGEHGQLHPEQVVQPENACQPTGPQSAGARNSITVRKYPQASDRISCGQKSPPTPANQFMAVPVEWPVSYGNKYAKSTGQTHPTMPWSVWFVVHPSGQFYILHTPLASQFYT